MNENCNKSMNERMNVDRRKGYHATQIVVARAQQQLRLLFANRAAHALASCAVAAAIKCQASDTREQGYECSYLYMGDS